MSSDPPTRPQTRAIPRRYQLRWILVIAFMLLATIPAGVIQLSNLSLTREQAEDQIFAQLETVVQLKHDQLRGRLNDGRAALRFFMAAPTAERVTGLLQAPERFVEDAAANAMLLTLVDVPDDLSTNTIRFSRTFVYRPDGTIVAASDDLMVGKLVSRQPYFQASLEGSHIQPPYYALGTSSLSMVVSEPVRDANGQLLGVLAGELDLAFLGEFMLQRSGLGETGETYLVSLESNYLLTPSRFEGYSLTEAYRSHGIDSALEGTNGQAIYQNYRKPAAEVFGAYRWVPELQAALLAEIEVNEALASYIEARDRSTGLTVLALVLATAVGLYVANRISNPITDLTAAAMRASTGDLRQQVEINQRNEIGVLANVFNTMTSELQQIQEGLEQRIIERTSDLQQATAEAEAARKTAEEANRLKDQFLANMSHELRTPLNSIINFAYILQAGIRGEVNDDQRDYLNRIYDSGEHLLGLINDILDLAKIESGRMDLYKEPLDIATLAQSVMSSAIGLLKDRPVELQQEITPGLPPVRADRTRIRQVMLNLLSNAAKFTEHGSITLRVIQQGRELIFSVTDTGIGIPGEHIESIFEEFRQVDGDTNRRYEGTGLGLAICRKLITMHGGRIWAESVFGQGSTFSFSLPLEETGPVTQRPIVPRLMTPLSAEDKAIVVVDDDPAAIEIIATYLEKDGYTVYGVADSRDALSSVRQINPVAIILDILMPHKDGWEVLASIKADEELEKIPVLLYTIVEDQKLGYYLGASAYLTKPINEDQLRTTVAQLVSNGATILVIDDDPNAVEIITQQLQRIDGYRVETANNGRAGLEQITKLPPDLIILDLMMPEVDGFAVLEELDTDATLRSIPVIVVTAKDLTREEHAFLHRRVHTLINKGHLSYQDMMANVVQVLNGAAGH